MRTGPRYLAQKAIAQVVVAFLQHGVQLDATLANHVHVVLLPKISRSRLLQSLKGSTARQANLIPRRLGETFWEAEAGLVRRAADYRWSSASARWESAETSLGAADTSVRATFTNRASPKM